VNQINEYRDEPNWISSLTKEQQYEWYLRAKQVLVRLEHMGDDTTRLNNAIQDYESRTGIV
jgi:hypothetical protein